MNFKLVLVLINIIITFVHIILGVADYKEFSVNIKNNEKVSHSIANSLKSVSFKGMRPAGWPDQPLPHFTPMKIDILISDKKSQIFPITEVADILGPKLVPLSLILCTKM